jgi:uncharacterized protein (TIGR02466 family)
MDSLTLFPTKISIYYNEALARKIEPLIDEYTARGEAMMGIDNHITTYNNPEEGARLNTDGRLAEAFQWCMSTALDDFHNRGWDVKNIKFQPHFFANEIRHGGFFHRHAHPNATISGCFYVNVPDGASDIIFHDPRPYKQCVMLPCREGFSDLLADEYPMKVKTGMLLIWSSWLEHEVVQNKSKLPRKTLVFNM